VSFDIIDRFVDCCNIVPGKETVPYPHCEHRNFEGECVIYRGKSSCKFRAPLPNITPLTKEERVYIWFLLQKKFTMHLEGDSIIVSDVENNITALEEFVNKDVRGAKEWCYDLTHDLLNV